MKSRAFTLIELLVSRRLGTGIWMAGRVSARGGDRDDGRGRNRHFPVQPSR